MNHLSSIPCKTCKNTHLLATIQAIRASVGDGLNDDELTRLLRQSVLTQAGFGFLSFSNGCVTLTVPEQELADWYPENGWIKPEKERLARAIADKYQLLLCEPPDITTSSHFPPTEAPRTHHHLEMSNRVATIVVAHPHYLKIRLYGSLPAARYVPNGPRPLPLAEDLLQDLAALYPA
jgi:hypothetical protein